MHTTCRGRSVHRRRDHIRKVLVPIILSSVLVISGCSSLALRDERVDRVLVEAQAFVEKGEYRPAVAIYESALAEDPQQTRLLYNLGLTYALSGDLASSLETLDRLNVLTANGNVKYLKAYGGVAAAAMEMEIAKESWSRVLELDPVDMDTRMRLVSLLMDSGDFESAYRAALQAYGLKQYSKVLFEKLSELEVSSGNGDGVSWMLIADTYR